MGERKGQNHYYPPDFFTNLKKNKNLNNYHGTTALRERGTKMHIGIITIRFEMPYNIWCEGCKNHIGMGKIQLKDIVRIHFKYFYFHFFRCSI